MFSKFKIQGFSPSIFLDSNTAEYFITEGQSVFDDNARKISSSLEEYIKANGHLDADKLSGDWFPVIDTDVFISHSHNDRENALLLAGFLKKQFGLKAFIDSTVWGNIMDLQQEVDEPLYDYTTHTYDYDKRNQTTAYVHLLLSTALTKMLDNSEAIFFLSSPHSVQSIENTVTSSVWIYHEIVTCGMLRRKYPIRSHLSQRCFASEGIIEGRLADGYTMDFKINLSDFKTINRDKVYEWKAKRIKMSSNIHSLDILYHLFDEAPKRRLIYG